VYNKVTLRWPAITDSDHRREVTINGVEIKQVQRVIIEPDEDGVTTVKIEFPAEVYADVEGRAFKIEQM